MAPLCPVDRSLIPLYNNGLSSCFVGIRMGLLTPILPFGTEGRQVKVGLNNNISRGWEPVIEWKTQKLDCPSILCLKSVTVWDILKLPFNNKERLREHFIFFFLFHIFQIKHAWGGENSGGIIMNKRVTLTDNGASLRRISLSLAGAGRWRSVGWSRYGCLISRYILRSSGA